MSEASLTGVSLGRVVRSEAWKLWTLRNYAIAVVLSALVLVGLAFAMADVTADDSGLAGGIVVAEPVALPMEYLAYVLMVIGVLVVSADIESGTATTTAALVPGRLRVLAGKALLVAAVGLVVGLVVLALVLGAVAVGAGVSLGTLLGADGATWGLVSDVAAVPLAALLGAAVGVLLRSGALAIAVLLLWSLAVETLLVFVIDERYGALLPFKTIGGSRTMMDELSAAQGLGLFVAYVVAFAAAAALVSVKREDAPR